MWSMQVDAVWLATGKQLSHTFYQEPAPGFAQVRHSQLTSFFMSMSMKEELESNAKNRHVYEEFLDSLVGMALDSRAQELRCERLHVCSQSGVAVCACACVCVRVYRCVHSQELRCVCLYICACVCVCVRTLSSILTTVVRSACMALCVWHAIFARPELQRACTHFFMDVSLKRVCVHPRIVRPSTHILSRCPLFSYRSQLGDPPFYGLDWNYLNSPREGCVLDSLTVHGEARNWKSAVRAAADLVSR